MIPPIVDRENRMRAYKTLQSIRASFTSDRNRIFPLQFAALHWSTTIRDQEFPVHFYIKSGNHETLINPNGTLNVTPISTTSYTLVARSYVLSKNLGTISVEVDTSECTEGYIDESIIRAFFVQRIDKKLEERRELSRRGPESVEIDNNGIHFRISLKASVDNWFDPDVNIHGTFKVFARDGHCRFSLVNYDCDLDFPWYEDLVNYSLMPAWLAIMIAEGNESDSARQDLIEGFQEALDGLEALYPDDAVLIFESQPNRLRYFLAPKRYRIWLEERSRELIETA